MLTSAHRAALSYAIIAPIHSRLAALGAVLFVLISLILSARPTALSTSLATIPLAQHTSSALARLSALFSWRQPDMNTSTSQAEMPNPPPSQVLNTRKEWQAELESLPTLEENGGKIPSVFLAHGQPMLLFPPHLAKESSKFASLGEIQGPEGLLAQFLQDFGPTLLRKYKPRAIVVLSAHYETEGGGVVTDYGEENPLLYDFFGFPSELYKVKFRSSGDSKLSREIVERLRAAGIKQARLTPKSESRGRDGRGFEGPGLDHGVFVPFKLMFGDDAPVPIVQVSIPSDLSPQTQRSIGEALEPFRSEGVLIISGGLTIHTFRDFSAFSPSTALPVYHSFESSIISALSIPSYSDRSKALDALTEHEGFRLSHPREEHFVPLYIAAGASRESEEKEGKESRVVCGLYGAKTVLFGV